MLAEAPDAERYVAELCDYTERSPGTVHPVLARLLKDGYVVRRDEQVTDPTYTGQGRRQRAYYRITAAGLAFHHRK